MTCFSILEQLFNSLVFLWICNIFAKGGHINYRPILPRFLHVFSSCMVSFCVRIILPSNNAPAISHFPLPFQNTILPSRLLCAACNNSPSAKVRANLSGIIMLICSNASQHLANFQQFHGKLPTP